MDPSRLPVTQAFLLLLAGLLASAAFAAQALDSSEGPPLFPIDESVYLGQIYPSGLLYLEGFEQGNDASAPGNWPEAVLFVPLDEEALPAVTRTRELATARLLGIESNVNPPKAERMLPAESPCVPEDYHPREVSAYVGGDGRPVPWEPAEYFATNEWFGCAREPAVAVYVVEGEIDASFRLVAFASDLGVVRLEWSAAGTRRPLTAAEADRVADRRARNRECTLQPRDREEAEQLLNFDLEDTPYRIRLSSHVTACTSLGEVFILDVLEGEDLLETREITRWRGNP